MEKCIYCLQDKIEAKFNVEHVIPESFGMFQDNMTLINTVCMECNQYFGDNLELFLGRDTLEGMLRFMEGIKAPEEFKIFKQKRLKVRLDEEGDWKGLIMVFSYSEEMKMVTINPVLQVGFKKSKTDEWIFFELEELKSKEELEKQGFIIKGKDTIKLIYGEENDEKQKLLNKLKNMGFALKGEESPLTSYSYAGRSVKTAAIGTVDKIVLRGIAKISFNYLAKIEGKEYVLNKNFNHVRDFIRHGRGKVTDFVNLENKPILMDERRFGIVETSAHMVTCETDKSLRVILSQITLFNRVVYKIIFCNWFEGILRKIHSGHHFDPMSKKISAMGRIPENFYLVNFKLKK